MKRLVIEIREPGDDEMGSSFDVVDEQGRRAHGLGFDEMLGQVVSLTHPKLGTEQYAMRTPEEWAAIEREREKRFLAKRALDDAPF